MELLCMKPQKASAPHLPSQLQDTESPCSKTPLPHFRKGEIEA